MSVRNLMRVMFPFLFCLLSVAAYAQVPNAGFENWSGGDPVGWATSNAPPVYSNVTASSTAHTGTTSVQGVVVQIYTQTIEPAIQSGPGGHGFPWTQRSASFSGYYQFAPVSGDRFGVNVWLMKAGTGVAYAAVADPTTRSSWTAFNVPFVYLTGDTPDTCIVQILIAAPDTASKPHAGSTFLLDDIALNASTGVVEGGEVPSSFGLEQNYPNPFNPTTGIRYSVAPLARRDLVSANGRDGQVSGFSGRSAFVSLKVFDLLGREVATLVNEQKTPGTYEVRFDGSGLASGVYVYRLTAGGLVESRKMILLR